MKESVLSTLVGLSLLCSLSFGDIYLHNPRGSNNRLNEPTSDRRNAKRLFDSQNNDRGGYNVGDKTSKPFQDEDGQYHMAFFQSGRAGKSYLTFEWTNQHGSGSNEKLNSNLVLQFMCQPEVLVRTRDTIRNGQRTSTQRYSKGRNERYGRYIARKERNNDVSRALHESWEAYDACNTRNRNKGLFTADQQLEGDSSIYTRQNPQGTRRGYECPEERDHYPYWHPTEWKDIAVLTSDTSRCAYYKKESFNVNPKGECVEKFRNGQRRNSKFNNKDECQSNGGVWEEFTNFLEKAPNFRDERSCRDVGSAYTWGTPFGKTGPECLVKLGPPDCLQAQWSRVNHNGNTPGGFMANYTWILPHFPSGQDQRCVFRMRYNISTDDYDGWNTDSSSNNQLIENNPEVNIGVFKSPLQLAMNTAQFGRTFQDRTHIIKLRSRQKYSVPDDKDIYNLNVRGKRGNIVQVYPAVEYDFIPNRLAIKKDDDLLHIQWTGSNTHNNKRDGDDGQGRSGTDRSNIVEMLDPARNYPLSFGESRMFKSATVVWSSQDIDNLTPEDTTASMASSGYYKCAENRQCKGNPAKPLNSELDNAPASYEGLLLQFTQKECYHYMCTRNNAFTNRSQKGTLCIK